MLIDHPPRKPENPLPRTADIDHPLTMSTLEDRKEDRIYSKVHHTLKGLNRTSPYDSHQLGTLKILDAIVEATDDDNVNKIDATLVLHQHALLALPKNTAEVLRISKGGSGLAIELVRRDLTEFSVLVRALYTSNEEQRTWDEGLHRLYNTLIPVVEVHGALVSAGVDVEQRAWAKALALQIPNLRRLRSTPWHEVALVLKLITLEEEDIEEGSAEGDDSPNMTAELYDSTVRPEGCTLRLQIERQISRTARLLFKSFRGLVVGFVE